MVAGGVSGDGISTVEVLTGDLGTKQLPNLPQNICDSSMAQHDGMILLCGGENNDQKCLKLDHGTWTEHSTLNKERYFHSAVATDSATFVFGGSNSRKTYEYLPMDSNTWIMGKTKIPGGFLAGGAIVVKSGQEIWLIGGLGTEKRILSFNVNDQTFQVLPSQLNVRRIGHRCAFIPNTKKIMITGGRSFGDGYLNSTEILDTEDGSVIMASPMNSKRRNHGMGVITINGEEKLAVFGGIGGISVLDSVEIYNTQTENWETTTIKLKEPKSHFGFLSVKLGDLKTEEFSQF